MNVKSYGTEGPNRSLNLKFLEGSLWKGTRKTYKMAPLHLKYVHGFQNWTFCITHIETTFQEKYSRDALLDFWLS